MAESRLSVGFPRMHKEAGEARDWLPSTVGVAARRAATVVVEQGIGSGMGEDDAAYVAAGPNVSIGTNEEAFDQDIVVTLRAPEFEEFEKLRPGATLVGMLHYPTRPGRVELLGKLGIEAIALDQIEDDAGERIVVNARGVAWNGLEAAFDALDERWDGMRDPARDPIHALVLGVGAIGRHAVDAALKLGDSARRDALMASGFPGVLATAAGRDMTGRVDVMHELLRKTDVLVDASQRSDSSVPLVPNAWLAELPPHAVVCDLVVDPYLLDVDPPTVRSIEGIPRGNLDKWIYDPDDEDWTATIPQGIPTDERRTTVTCYSWPGVRARACMELYGAQLGPLLEVLIQTGGAAGLDANGGFHERALWRGSLAALEG